MIARAAEGQSEPSSLRAAAIRVAIAVSAIIVMTSAGTAWWVLRFRALELAAVFEEAFRKAALPESEARAAEHYAACC
jgi:hypothetical protein